MHIRLFFISTLMALFFVGQALAAPWNSDAATTGQIFSHCTDKSDKDVSEDISKA